MAAPAMTILFISDKPPFPADEGGRIRARFLTTTLCRRHQVDLLFCKSAREGIDFSPYQHFRQFWFVNHDATVTNFKRLLSLFSYLPCEAFWLKRCRALFTQMQVILKKQKYHFVIFGSEALAFLVEYVKGTRVILDACDSQLLQVRRRQDFAKKLLSRLYVRSQIVKIELYERYFLPKFDQIFFISKHDEKYMRSRLGFTHGVVIPSGIRMPAFSILPKNRKGYQILFLANFSYYPNFDAARWFIHEVWLPSYHDFDAELTLVGKSPPREILKWHGKHNIRVTGYVKDLRNCFDAHTICVSPLRLGSGLKMKILHALAMGTPVVATPLSIEGLELAINRGVLLAVSPNDFKTGILRLLKDEELRKQMSFQGRAFVRENFSVRKTEERLLQMVADSQSGLQRLAEV